MRLSTRTVAAMLAVAVIPLTLAGWSALRLSNDALRSRVEELHGTALRLVSVRLDDELVEVLESAKLAAASIEFGDLDDVERLGAVRLLFRQLRDVSVAILVRPDGRPATPPVFLREKADDPALGGRLIVDERDVERFADNIPLSAARSVGVAIGHPYVSTTGSPRLAVAARTHGDLVFAIEVTLEKHMRMMTLPRLGPRGRAFVVDDDGRVVLARDRDAVARQEDRSAWPLVASTLAGDGDTGEYEDPEYGTSVGTGGKLKHLRWAVILSEPIDEAFLASRLLTRQLLIWLLFAAVAAGLAGWAVGRALARPVHALHRGALELHNGALTHRVAGADRRDELGDLARAFNDMASEIQRWNHELEQRVQDQTQELRDAQEMLIRTHKLAAIGQLGAGIAHEVNNPLAGILGMAQLMLDRLNLNEPERRMLRSIESEALRIREIVASLSRMATGEEGVMLRPTDVHAALEAALALVERQMAEQGIEVVRDFGDVPEAAGDGDRLSDVFLQLISNARRAMPSGGTLTLSTRAIEEQLVEVRVEDTGIGIPKELQARIFEPFYTEKTEWRATGMGLTIVNRIIEAHHGSIAVHSAPGEGTTFTVLLPVAQVRPML
jgi:signal transduction histidine kinase